MSCTCQVCPGCVAQSFRQAILPALSAADSIMLALDLAPTVVTIITRKWSLGRRKIGAFGDTELALPRWLTVEEISNSEVAQSGGRFVLGNIRVGPIRPYFTNTSCNGPGAPGGFTIAQLAPTVPDESTEIIYRLAQAHSLGTGWSGDYALQELIREDPLEFYLILRRRSQTENAIPALGL